MNNHILTVFRKFNIANTHIYVQIQRQILDIKFSPQVLLWVYKLVLSLKKFSQPLFHKIVHMRQRLQKYFWLMNFEALVYTCCPEIQVPSFPWTHWSQIPAWGLVIYSLQRPCLNLQEEEEFPIMPVQFLMVLSVDSKKLQFLKYNQTPFSIRCHQIILSFPNFPCPLLTPCLAHFFLPILIHEIPGCIDWGTSKGQSSIYGTCPQTSWLE